MDLSTKVKETPETDLKAWLLGILESACRDFGQKPDVEEMQYLTKRVLAEVKKRRDWMLSEVSTAIDSGVRGMFDGAKSTRINPAVVYKWIHQQGIIREKRFMREQSHVKVDADFSKKIPANLSAVGRMFFAIERLVTDSPYLSRSMFPALEDCVKIEKERGMEGLLQYVTSKKQAV